MTREDVKGIIGVLRVAYPAFYNKQSYTELTSTVNLWAEMFAEEDVNLVKYALYKLIETHEGYPPDIASVKKQLKEIRQTATGESSADELWGILIDAVRRYGIYEPQKGFDSLPPVLQKYCGSSSHIRELAVIDTTTLNTVTYSTFLKQIKIAQQRLEAAQEMPEAVSRLVNQMYKPIGEGDNGQNLLT